MQLVIRSVYILLRVLCAYDADGTRREDKTGHYVNSAL